MKTLENQFNPEEARLLKELGYDLLDLTGPVASMGIARIVLLHPEFRKILVCRPERWREYEVFSETKGWEKSSGFGDAIQTSVRKSRTIGKLWLLREYQDGLKYEVSIEGNFVDLSYELIKEIFDSNLSDEEVQKILKERGISGY